MAGRGKLAIAATVAITALVAAFGTSTSADGAATARGESGTGLTDLEKVQRALKQAEKRRPLTDGWYDNLSDARIHKARFVERGFAGIEFFGCPAAKLLEDLETIDVELARAGAISHVAAGRQAVGFALGSAFDLDKRVAECAVIEELPEPKLTRQILAKVRDLRDRYGRGLDGHELRREAEEIHELKLRLLAGETVNGCEARGLFELIDQLDIVIELARVVAFNVEHEEDPDVREAKQEARRLVKRAFGIADGLSRIWSVCGSPPG